MKMVHWTELGDDLLAEVALKLDAVEDFVYFSVVCRTWNRASSLVKRKWKPSMPYLLLAENHNENPNFLRQILSINNDRCYQLSLPQTFETRCYGSSIGWLVSIDLDGQIHLLNPLTKERLLLPPQSTMPNRDLPLDGEEEDPICRRQDSIRKVIVVKDVERGNDGNDLIVFVSHTHWKRLLAFARPGDQTWTTIVPPWPSEEATYDVPFSHRAVDLVLRDNTLLILYEDASIGYLDLSDLSTTTNLERPVKAKEFLPSPEELKSRLDTYLLEMYLVESFGSLLMVHRNKSDLWLPDSLVDEEDRYETVGFEVFRFDIEVKKWKQVKDVGDVALFIGDNHSISVRASNCRNCKSNCIYFTDDYAEHWDKPAMLGGHDMGIFDLKIGEFYKFYKGVNGNSDVCTPFWFMPQF